jgi:spermidine synthase
VIDWHVRHLVPLGGELTGDPRCHLVHGDFFSMVADGLPFTGDGPTRFDAILVDIDHSPRHLLDPRHASFYEPDGLRRLAEKLSPGGVFALWSNDPVDDAFLAVLGSEFHGTEAHVVTFPNFYQDRDASSTIYVAVTAGAHVDTDAAASD